MGLQDERREQTRMRLLEATVACLVERGFANLTTAEVAQRAGVSKGAQLYHFPKKDDLVVAALKHLFAERMEASRQIVSALPKEMPLRMGALIDDLWTVYKGDVFFAWLELVVAGRTDIALRDEVQDASLRLSVDTTRLWQAVFPELDADLMQFHVLNQIINGQLASLSLFNVLEESRDSPEVVSALSAIKEVGNFMLERMRRRDAL